MKYTIEQYKRVYEMLEDGPSREIYLNRINWLISGNRKYIDAIVTDYLPKAHLFAGKIIQRLNGAAPKGRFLEREAVQELKGVIPKDVKVIFYGAGTLGRNLLQCWQDDERFIGFCSQTKDKQKNGYCGYPVMCPEELLLRKDLTVVISTHRANEEIKQILKDGGYPEEQIYSANDFLRYEDPGQYFNPEFMFYEEEEVFVDVGCCDLNSSLELRKYCKHVKKVYAFEPDPENYAVCLERKTRFRFPEVELLPFGAWSERRSLCFDATNDGVSHICEHGSTHVSAVPIDEAIDASDRITMIKMDIEGAELEALKGARKTIQRDKPKLAICIYHKPEDMTEIPVYIKGLVPEYKLYIRHHSNWSGETVLYAIPPR